MSEVGNGFHPRLLLSFDEIETQRGWTPLMATIIDVPGEHGLTDGGRRRNRTAGARRGSITIRILTASSAKAGAAAGVVPSHIQRPQAAAAKRHDSRNSAGSSAASPLALRWVCVWGGHSCPPLLTFGLKSICLQSHCSILRVKIQVKGGGQECPPHTRTSRILWHHGSGQERIYEDCSCACCWHCWHAPSRSARIVRPSPPSPTASLSALMGSLKRIPIPH